MATTTKPAEQQKSEIKLLISKGLEQGYLTYAEVNDHLPDDLVDPDQIEDIIGMINGMGIQVHEVAPDAAGAAVAITASADTIVASFRAAAVWALLAIAVILIVALRRAVDVALVLAPLLLSSMLTVLFAVLLPLPLNFANIIALPLLLGLGVSFSIYFVMNWRAGRRDFLSSATARAIVFSALTTGTAFGSLAASGHPGTASMGLLLLISLGCTLITSLVFMPALLATAPNESVAATRR